MFKALKLGHSLKNPEQWKRVQYAINVASAFIPVLAILFPQFNIVLASDFLAKLYGAIGVVNAYLTTATTNKIGL